MRSIAIIFITLFSLTGCSTSSDLEFDSEPVSVRFVITNENGKIVAEGVTPQKVSLANSELSYFSKKKYGITLSHDNYMSISFSLEADRNGWYLVRSTCPSVICLCGPAIIYQPVTHIRGYLHESSDYSGYSGYFGFDVY